jgi:hypothetical protein
MTKLEKIAAKARAGDELTEDEMEYVVELLMKFSDLVEQTIEWLRPTIVSVVSIWLDALKKLEEEHKT